MNFVIVVSDHVELMTSEDGQLTIDIYKLDHT
jgi:hypothetical protein